MLPAKLSLKQLEVIWHSMINSIINQRWSGKYYCLLPKYLYLTCTWLKKYLMYLMSSKYSEYLNLYLYLQTWKSTCTWLKYFKKYLTPTLNNSLLYWERCHCDQSCQITLDISRSPIGFQWGPRNIQGNLDRWSWWWWWWSISSRTADVHQTVVSKI